MWTGEAEAGVPYWWEGLESVPLDAGLPERCDLLVIGAGYTGLSAALAAQSCGARVVVVDAGIPGEGASSRNGGMFGAHPRLSWERLSRNYGADVADAIFAEATPALHFVRALIEGEGIDCDLHETGRIQLAWSGSHFEGQKRLAQQLRDKTDVAVRVVDRAGLSAEIATQQYFGGLLFEQHCAIQPAKFHRGLLRAALGRSIPVVAHAEVQALEREGAGFAARTPKGQIRADKVILATNGYTGAAFRWHLARVFPVPSYMMATEELSSNVLGRLAPGRRMMVETRAQHSYFRLSPDGKRVLFGARSAMVNIDLQIAARRLKQTMTDIWPELAEVRASHVWTGNTGFSFGHVPHVGEQDGLHHAMGFSGSGTVMAPYLGAKAAYRAMGDPRGETAYAQTSLPRNLVHPFRRPHFLSAVNAWYRGWADWRDKSTGRQK